MRWRRVLYRNHVAQLVGCTLLVGFYAGRISAGSNRSWIEFPVLAVWLTNAVYWIYSLRREAKREHQEFKREMRLVAEGIIRRRFQEEIDGDS